MEGIRYRDGRTPSAHQKRFKGTQHAVRGRASYVGILCPVWRGGRSCTYDPGALVGVVSARPWEADPGASAVIPTAGARKGVQHPSWP